MFLAPPLSEVLEQAGQAASGTVPGSALQSALEAASHHVDQGRQFLEVVVWTLPPGDAADDAEARARQDLSDLAAALADVARASGVEDGRVTGTVDRGALERAVRGLSAAAGRMGDSLEELRRLESEAPHAFPLPEVDRVLRVGLRALRTPGRAAEAHGAIQAFLPAAVAAVQRFGTASPAAAALCGDEGLAERLRTEARELEHCLGAMMSYVRSGTRQDLQTGCDRLQERAGEVGTLSQELTRKVEAARGDRPAPLHLLLQAMRTHVGDGPGLMVAELTSYLESARTDAEALARQPLGALQECDWPGLARRATEARTALEAVAVGLQLTTPVSDEALHDLERRVLDLAREWEPAARGWMHRRVLLGEVPALRPAAEAVGGALLGRLRPAEVDPLLGRLESLASDLSVQALRGGNAELAELLDQQRHALEAAREALQHGHRDALRAAWLRLEADLPRLLEVSEELQAAVRPSGPTEYYDVHGGDAAEAGWAPRRLAELEALARRVASGDAPQEELTAEAERWSARIEEARRRGAEELLPALQGDAEQRSYVEFFLERLDVLSHGVERLASGDLEGGVEVCAAAGEDLLAMRFQISEFFR